jgi:hypothetical protein
MSVSARICMENLPAKIGYSASERRRLRTKAPCPLSQRLGTLGEVARCARRDDVGLYVFTTTRQRDDVVKVRGDSRAVGAAMTPASQNCRPAIGHMLHAVGLSTPLVRQLMALIRRQTRVIPAPMVGSSLPAAGRATRRNALRLASQKAFSRLGAATVATDFQWSLRTEAPRVTAMAMASA